MDRIKMAVFVFLLGICIALVVFGICLFNYPYLLVGNQESEGFSVWTYGTDLQALILFNFSSRGLITANYPVSVTATILASNDSLLSLLKGKKYVEMDISGSYAYPVHYGVLGVYDGAIKLQFKEDSIFQGSSDVIFPYVGSSYFYAIYASDVENDMSPPIYTMNITDVKTGGTVPPFEIDEGYASRTSYEQASQNTALSMTVVGLTGLAIVVAIVLEYGKKGDKDLEKLVAELDNIKEKVNLIQQYQKQILELEQKHRKS